MIPDHKKIEKTGDDRPAKSLFGFVWRMSGWSQIRPVSLALAIAALSIAPLELQRRIIDDGIKTGDVELIYWLGGLYLAVIILHGLAKLLMQLCQGWLAESTILYCRRHLAKLHDKHHETRRIEENGTAVSIIRAEIEQVGNFVGIGLSEPIAQMGILVTVLGYMLYVEPLIALCSAIFLVPQILFAPILQRKLNALVEERIGYLRELTENVPDYPDSDEARGDFRKLTSVIYRNQMVFFIWKFSGKAAINFMNAVAPISVLVIGGIMVIQDQTEIGIVVAFISGFSKLSDPIRELITYYRDAAQTAVKHQMIADWM